ncbi:zinc/manganese transport system ATP-binding protein [Kushneria sinocarnis]|uniref:Zinc/manganese transport system ATP-binding protein n=1 Tax=Kushneria sinocarnis TaxID=595502 RepID=A0A420WU75_9GAMM|nr:ATP-binding cassette domain-containing protein [Kushneria sinocarnis]RKQ96999.1 zinc/manganese transport system ATP-binding protein [Kushneria sinocarnis]
MAADGPAVTARAIAAGRGAQHAFGDLSFELPGASFTALAGPNGSGKTTLFETLLGLVRLDRGELDVFGQSPRRARTAVAYVPQAGRLLHDGQFIGREFVAAAWRARRWGISWHRKDAAQAVDHALTQVDGHALARRRLGELSGGQQQRLLVAQALVNQPRLLLMDEPLASLDPAAQEQIVALAAHLRDCLGMTVLFSTHDVNPVVDVADQVLYLAGGSGRLGTIAEIVNDEVLSALYGVPMHVVRERGRLFVMRDQAAGGSRCAAEMARDAGRCA